MAKDATVEFIGAAELQSDLRLLTERLHQDDIDALLVVARMLVPHVRSIMPKVSGALAGSVAAEKAPDDPKAVDVIANTAYAGWIEFGGTRDRPYLSDGRFLFPTVNQGDAAVRNALETQTQRTIGRFPWRHPA